MAQFLRTATPDGDWRSFKFTHAITGTIRPGGVVTESYIYMVQETVGVLILDIQYSAAGCKEAKTIVTGEEGVLIYHAEKINVRKRAGTGYSFLPGDKVYWSGVQGDPVTPTYQSTYYWIGICVWPAADDDEFVIIDLKGDKVSITEPL